MIVFIDEFGKVVQEKESVYKVTLSGSYSWCFVSNSWRYEVKKTEPNLPLTYILLKEKL